MGLTTLVLAATTSKIVGALSGAITTTQPDFTVHYADDTGSAFTEGEQDGTFNSTTQVDICTAPASSTRRVIRNITVYNRDTVSVTFTLKYSANATLRFITKVTLATGESWDFTPTGPTGATGATGGAGAAGSPAIALCNGRLTLESGVPVSTTDQTAKTTIYWTPYRGNQISLYDGVSAWGVLNSAEVSLALGTLASAVIPNDVFAFNNSGTLTLEKLAWTNATTRATALVLQDGVLVKSGATTRRYLGTFYPTSTTTTEDSGGGTVTQTGGKRFLWNYHNRVRRDLSVIDTTTSWSYTTDTWRQANGATGNKVEFVCGVSEDVTEGMLLTSVTVAGSSARGARTAVGVDSTSAPTKFGSWTYSTAGDTECSATIPYTGYPGIGYHFLAWLERGGDGICAFKGIAQTGAQTGLCATVFG